MESSRDSSVWRSLAVTFGGGLALGAVGMKLTQTALRPMEIPARSEPDPVTDRLSSVERRLERVEQAPAPARTAAAGRAAPAPAPMDQKVLEAVIGAVEARLHEHAGPMDRRLADLEARLAVMQSVNEQDRHAAERLRQEAVAFRTALEQDMRQVREGVSQTVAGQTAVQTATQTDLQTLREQQERIIDAAEQRFADMRQEYRKEIADLRREMEHSIETRIITAAATAAAAQIEEQLAPLRAEVRQKEEELAELRQRLADSERSVLDVVLAIGAVCRQAADRIAGPRERGPAAPPLAPPAEIRPRPEAGGPAPAEFTAMATPAPAPKVETLPVMHAEADPALAQGVPDFLHESNHRSSWRIPLVSSFLVSTGYLVLMHYLSTPLQ